MYCRAGPTLRREGGLCAPVLLVSPKWEATPPRPKVGVTSREKNSPDLGAAGSHRQSRLGDPGLWVSWTSKGDLGRPLQHPLLSILSMGVAGRDQSKGFNVKDVLMIALGL